MATVLMRHSQLAARRDKRHALATRALKAMSLALALISVGYAWQTVSSERTALRAEQARIARLQLTPQKLQALAREAHIAAAAHAYADTVAAEKAWRDAVHAAQDAAAKAHARRASKI